MQLKLSLVWLLAVATIVVSVSGAPASETEIAAGTATKQAVRVGFSPAKLFDFNNYKTLFHKTYSGLLEELVRGKYFLSRAFRAFISAIKYKYRKSPFYLAVNEMSDWTPEEIDKSENKVLAQASEEKISKAKEGKNDEQVQGGPQDDLPEFLPEDVDEVQDELRKLADSAKPGEPGYDELKLVTGQAGTSAPAKTHDGKVRDLPIEKLIDTGEDVQLNPEAARKLANRVPSNNPEYEPHELPSYGLSDEINPVEIWTIKYGSQSKPPKEFRAALSNVINGLEDSEQATVELPDEVFVDLRDTGCLTLPRQQGKCGSCWAFAAISIFEYLYCMKTSKLVPFSEQYLVDCGDYIPGAFGCEGGLDTSAAHFVKNFGLELRIHYPYNARQNQCPYEESMELKSTGYIRFEFNDAVEINVDQWPQYIQNGPLHIAISLSPGFREYGGGVIGWGCNPLKPTHSVVLVGHGREDGDEYWLIRNSHSVGWGEGGYGKLAKKANCIGERVGLAYATMNGERTKLAIRRNKLNDRSLVMNRYKQIMLL